MQLGTLSCVCKYSIFHKPETVSSNTCSQMHAEIKDSLVHLQDLIPAMAGMYKT